MPRLFNKSQWGGKHVSHASSMRRHGGRAVVHYTASEMEDFDIDAGRPMKPGPKWYKLWRTPHKTAAEKARRVRIARVIRKYNKAMAKWRAGNASKYDAMIKHERKMMRGWQSYHMRVLGWKDIGYHYVIFPSGNIYEGRPANGVTCANGAHTYGANDRIGISHEMTLGEYPTREMRESYAWLVGYLGIREAVGHKQVPGNSTSCPGSLIQAYGLPARY